MTQTQLHSIKDFHSLQTDDRFAALMIYLKERRPRLEAKEPHGMIQDGGKLDAYLKLIDTIEEAFRAPSAEVKVPRAAGPYQTANLPEQKA